MFTISKRVEIVNTTDEEPILAECLAQFEEFTGIKAEAMREPNSGDQDTYVIRLETKPELRVLGVLRRNQQLINDQVHHITLVAKNLLRTSQANYWGVLFLAPWIAESWGKILKENGINFVDTVGNIYLSIEQPQFRIFVDVQGKKPEQRPKADPGRLIEPSGLKLIHYLLTPLQTVGERLTLPYRKIADQAGVSASTVSIVLRELGRVGFLSGFRRRLENVPSLVDLFVRGYELKLRPELLIGRFRHPIRDTEALSSHLRELLKNAGGRWALAGAAGADVLTRHLKTENVALLVDEASEEAVRADRILEAPKEGNLVLFRLFAPTAIASSDANYLAPTASPLLIYAELLNDGRPREMETAELIRPLILPNKVEQRGS